MVAIDKYSKKVLAIGAEAKEMVGRTPASIVAIRPLRDGVISDFDITEKMLHYFIHRVHERNRLLSPSPRVAVGIPSGVTEVEKRAVEGLPSAQARAKPIWSKSPSPPPSAPGYPWPIRWAA